MSVNRKKGNENGVLIHVEYYSAVKNIIMNIGGKSMDLANDYPECSNSNSKRQMWYRPVYMWVLAFRHLIGIPSLHNSRG